MARCEPAFTGLKARNPRLPVADVDWRHVDERRSTLVLSTAVS